MNKKRTEYLHIRITPETAAKIEAQAEKTSMTKTAIVQLALNDYLSRQPDRTTEERAKYGEE